jgi:DNA processing protein
MPETTAVPSNRAARAALMHFAPLVPDLHEEVAAHGAVETWNRHAHLGRYGMGDYDAEAELLADLRECAFVVPGDWEWPPILDHAGPTAPLGFWARRAERLPYLTQRSALLTGNRHATPAGQRLARESAEDFVHAGVTVIAVSSRGVGAAVLDGASNGRTLLVLPCGLDQLFPDGISEHVTRVLAGGGALVSLERPHRPASGATVQAAPVLAAALSSATLLIESRAWTSDRLSAAAAGATRASGRPLLALDTRDAHDVNPGNAELLGTGVATAVRTASDALAHIPAACTHL